FGPGRTAGIPVNATNTAGSTDASRSQIAVDSAGTVHIVYDDDVEFADGLFNAHLYYIQSTDGGQTFTPPIRLDTGDSTSQRPLPDDGQAGDDDIPDGFFLVASTLFAQNTNFKPSISVDPSGTIYITPRNSNFKPGELDTQLFVRRSTDGGKSFSSPTIAVSAVSLDNSFTENDHKIDSLATSTN